MRYTLQHVVRGLHAAQRGRGVEVAQRQARGAQALAHQVGLHLPHARQRRVLGVRVRAARAAMYYFIRTSSY